MNKKTMKEISMLAYEEYMATPDNEVIALLKKEGFSLVEGVEADEESVWLAPESIGPGDEPASFTKGAAFVLIKGSALMKLAEDVQAGRFNEQ